MPVSGFVPGCVRRRKGGTQSTLNVGIFLRQAESQGVPSRFPRKRWRRCVALRRLRHFVLGFRLLWWNSRECRISCRGWCYFKIKSRFPILVSTLWRNHTVRQHCIEWSSRDHVSWNPWRFTVSIDPEIQGSGITWNRIVRENQPKEEAQAKLNEYHEAQGSHDERVGAAAVINCHFQDGETTCRQLSKRLPDNSTIFAGEATAITLALNYYRHMGQIHHDVVVYSDTISCLRAIEGEDTENPFICHIMNLVWLLSNKGTHLFLLDTKPLWHWGKWKSGPTCKRDPWSRHRPIGKCSLYRFETTGLLLHSEVGSNQMGCSCTWQRSLSRETNIGAPEEIPASYQSWRGCNHQTSNWPYEGRQIPYLIPRTTDCLSPLWSNTDHWAYAPRMCSVTGMSWWILHSWLIECSHRDNSWDLHGRIPARSGIFLSDMM